MPTTVSLPAPGAPIIEEWIVERWKEGEKEKPQMRKRLQKLIKLIGGWQNSLFVTFEFDFGVHGVRNCASKLCFSICNKN